MILRILGGVAGLAAVVSCATRPKETEAPTLPPERPEGDRHAMLRKVAIPEPARIEQAFKRLGASFSMEQGDRPGRCPQRETLILSSMRHFETRRYEFQEPVRNDWLRIYRFSWHSEEPKSEATGEVWTPCNDEVWTNRISLAIEVKDTNQPAEWQDCSITMERNNRDKGDSMFLPGYWTLNLLTDTFFCGRKDSLRLSYGAQGYSAETIIGGIYQLLNLTPPPAPK